MAGTPDPTQALAAMLATSDDLAARLPDALPCAPLDLMVALHQEVTRTMLSDLAYAQRAAAAAWCVAGRFPADPLLQAQAHWTQGTAILYIPDYTRSLEHYDAALEWYERARQITAPDEPVRDVRIVHIVRVACLSDLGRYAEARQAADIAEHWLHTHPNEPARLTLLLNQSLLAEKMGAYVEMLCLADAIITHATRLRNESRLAHGWINRAIACLSLGRLQQAEEALDRGIQFARLAGEPITVARGMLNRANLLRIQGHLFAALTTLREAEQGFSQAAGEAASVEWFKATIYEQLCQYAEALRAARFAAHYFARHSMPTYSVHALLRAVRITVVLEQPSVAQATLQQAQVQATIARLPVLDAQVTLAEALVATLPHAHVAPRMLARMRRDACNAAQQAVALLQAHGFDMEWAEGQLTIARLQTQLGRADAARDRYAGLLSHHNRQVRLHANAELGALLPPEEALPYLERAVQLAEEQRRMLPMEELQARYSTETSPHHMRLAHCYVDLGEVQRAFETVAAAKAGPLLDLRAAASSPNPLFDATLQAGKATIARWRAQRHEHLQSALQAAQSNQQERLVYHQEQARIAESEALAAEQQLTVTLHTWGDRNGQASVPTLHDIQRTLDPDTALLEYAQYDDQVIGFLLLPDHPIIHLRLGSTETLARLLDRWNLSYRRLLATPAPAEHEQLISTLKLFDDVLIGPWRDSLQTTDHLMIAPYGILHHVPWSALWDGAMHLSDRYTITLTPCSAFWAASFLVRSDAPLMVGPPLLLGYGGAGGARLQHIDDEISTIAAYMPEAQVNTAATSAALRASPPPRILHIATHAHTNTAAPICSTLELADGPFMLCEVHRLNLRGVELVTLSACETGVRPDYGDMALALAGAFLCAGAQMALASLWEVSDATTAHLMEHFYAALARGLSAPCALRQAQGVVRADHPFDWAAFQLWIGAGMAPQERIALPTGACLGRGALPDSARCDQPMAHDPHIRIEPLVGSDDWLFSNRTVHLSRSILHTCPFRRARSR